MSSLFYLPWSRRRLVNQPDTAAPSLRTLPPELFLMIALQLPLADAANFALINRRLSMLIGPIYWPQLRTDVIIPGLREQFLNTLARDLPSWFYCYSCSQLHRLERIKLPGPFDRPSKSLLCSDGYLDSSYGEPYPNYRFSFHHLQLVMRRYYLGPSYGIPADDLSFVQVNELGESELKGRRTTLFSLEARVCTEPARLCLRIQRWAVLHTNILELAVERAKCIKLCVHHDLEEDGISQLIASSLEGYLTRSEGGQEPERRVCRGCRFDYGLQVLDTGSDGLAIVITEWLDLGSGLTPLDQKWSLHTEPWLAGDATDHAGDAERCRLEFEKEEGLKQQAITLRNASYLSQQQYRKTMKETSAGVWILQAHQAGPRRKTYKWLGILILLSVLLGSVVVVVVRVVVASRGPEG